MAVMASWNGKTWGVSSQRIAALNGVSHRPFVKSKCTKKQK